MDDRHHVPADTIVDDIGKPAEPEGVDTKILDYAGAPGRVA
jgi:hypothetical protein